MWVLSFVPDSILLYIVNTILVVGAVGSFLTFFVLHRILNKFPTLAPYYLLLQVVSAVLLITGIYLKGGYSVEMDWREKLHVAEERARAAEQQAKQINEKIVIQYRDKVNIVKENVVVYQDRIKEVEKIINQDCKVAPQVIDIHNDAAANRRAETKK